jgi:hypothetical protein
VPDSFLSGSGPEPRVSDGVVKSALDGKPVRVVRVDVVRSDGRPGAVYATTKGELDELEAALGADPGVEHWLVSEREITFNEGGEV